MFLAPAFVQQGDRDGDRALSAEEFRALGESWFAQWDKESSGKVSGDQLKAGLNATLAPPAPPAGSLPPARPGGMNLQGAEGKRNGLSAAAGIEFDYVPADLEFDGAPFANVALRFKGNGTFMQSRGSEKRSLKVDLNKFAKGQSLAHVSTLNLHNSVTDASWMNEVLSYRLFRDAGVPAPRTAYARVSVSVPGKWDRKLLGLYALVENVDKDFADELFGSKKGALFKPVTPQPFTDLGDDWKAYAQTYDPKTDLKAAQKQRVIDFCKLVSHADDAEFAAKLGDFLDVEEFARFMSVTVWLSALDSILGPGQNYYVYLHPKTQKFQFLPWDLDHSFGQFFLMGTPEQREALSLQKPWRGENLFLARVFATTTFQQHYRARLEEFSRTIFLPERFHAQVDELAAAIRPTVAEESEEKLARFDKAVAGETVAPAGFGAPPGAPAGAAGSPPQPGGGAPGFPGAGKPIKGFVAARAQSVLAQLAGTAKGEIIGDFGPGGPGAFGPGNFLWRPFMAAFDTDKDESLTREEALQGFAKWWSEWNGEGSSPLSEEQLRDGLNRTLAPNRGAPSA